MNAMAARITSISFVCSTVCPGSHQRKHQISALLAFARGIHRWPVDYPYQGPVTRKRFPFDEVIMFWDWLWFSMFGKNKPNHEYMQWIIHWLSRLLCSLPHPDWDKMATISADDISKGIFVNRKWNFDWKGICVIRHYWSRQWLGAEQAISRYLNQWWLRLLRHICLIWSVNDFSPLYLIDAL